MINKIYTSVNVVHDEENLFEIQIRAVKMSQCNITSMLKWHSSDTVNNFLSLL